MYSFCDSFWEFRKANDTHDTATDKTSAIQTLQTNRKFLKKVGLNYCFFSKIFVSLHCQK